MESFTLNSDKPINITQNIFGANALTERKEIRNNQIKPPTSIVPHESESDESDESDNDEELADREKLKKYYLSLSQEEIEYELEIMRVGSNLELYQLIANDCRKYVSIIENYSNANLQNEFNFNIKWIEGHLLIKYKLDPLSRVIEVGFFDNNNSMNETLDELKKSIEVNLKTYSEDSLNRRKHIAGHFEQEGDSTQTNRVKSNDQLPLSADMPKPTPKQLEAAGYKPVPKELKSLEKDITGGFVPDLNKLNQTSIITNESLSTDIKIKPNDAATKQIESNNVPTKQIVRDNKIAEQLESHNITTKEINGTNNNLEKVINNLEKINFYKPRKSTRHKFSSSSRRYPYDANDDDESSETDETENKLSRKCSKKYNGMISKLKSTNQHKEILKTIIQSLPNLTFDQLPYAYSFLDGLIEETSNDDLLSYCIDQTLKK